MDPPVENVKAVFLGGSKSGKTRLITTFLNIAPSQEHKPTLFENYYKDLSYNRVVYRVFICDTGGHADFNRLKKMSYLNANVFVLCVSYDERDALEEAKSQMEDLKATRMPVILCLTKADIGKSISIDQIQKFSNKYGIHGIYECSAKDRKGIKHLFRGVIQAHVDGIATKSGCCSGCCHIC